MVHKRSLDHRGKGINKDKMQLISLNTELQNSNTIENYSLDSKPEQMAYVLKQFCCTLAIKLHQYEVYMENMTNVMTMHTLQNILYLQRFKPLFLDIFLPAFFTYFSLHLFLKSAQKSSLRSRI